MTNKDSEILADIAVKVGLDPYKIKNENPHKFSGKVSQQLIAGAAEFYPEVNAKWRSEVSTISPGTMAELRSGKELSSRAKQDLYDHDPQFVRDCQRQVSDSEQQMLKQWEQEAADKRLKNTMLRTGGNAAMAQRLIAEEDAASQAHAEKQAAWTTGVQS